MSDNLPEAPQGEFIFIFLLLSLWNGMECNYIIFYELSYD